MQINVGSEIGFYCATVEDGQSLYNIIISSLRTGDPVEIDLSNLKTATTPFLNAAFGQLTKEFEKAVIFSNLKFIAPERTIRSINRVIENAYDYYHNPEKRDIINKIVMDSVQ
jgi:hypothetical protein